MSEYSMLFCYITFTKKRILVLVDIVCTILVLLVTRPMHYYWGLLQVRRYGIYLYIQFIPYSLQMFTN